MSFQEAKTDFCLHLYMDVIMKNLPHCKMKTVNHNFMKASQPLLMLAFFVTVVSCGRPNGTETKTALNSDTKGPGAIHEKEQERLAKRKQMEEKDYSDSLILDKVLQDALKTAGQNIGKDKFTEQYKISPDSVPLSVEINSGYYFTKVNPQLIIRRSAPDNIYIDIYSRIGAKFEKVVSHEQWRLTYVGDTIRDINGDGLKDFVVNGYGSNGCCLKAFSDVYLLRPDKKTFSESFEFINPTFSPGEKIIRGICYGHPGETEMYKYKWNGEQIDTVEYVSYEERDNGVKTGKVLITTGWPYSDKSITLKVLNSVPEEYRKINGYDWFTGEGFD